MVGDLIEPLRAVLEKEVALYNMYKREDSEYAALAEQVGHQGDRRVSFRKRPLRALVSAMRDCNPSPNETELHLHEVQ